jgi:hypothetical protein
MKKCIIIALSLIVSSVILATIVIAISVRQFTANEVDFKVVINGEEHKFNQPIVTIEDRTYLPIREFCNAAGYSINWDEEGRVVSMSDKKEVVFNDDVCISREGALESGRKYIFYGTDKQDFSIKNYIEKAELFESIIYDIKIREETIEAMDAINLLKRICINKKSREDFTPTEWKSFKFAFQNLLDVEHNLEMLKLALAEWVDIPEEIHIHNDKCYRKFN